MNHALLEHPHVIATPHLGASTAEAQAARRGRRGRRGPARAARRAAPGARSPPPEAPDDVRPRDRDVPHRRPRPDPPEGPAGDVDSSLNHRGDYFHGVVREIRDLLPVMFGTTGHQVILSGSGTAGLEAMYSSLLPREGRILVLSNGNFGERSDKIVRQYATNVTTVTAPWGQPIAPAAVRAELEKGDVRAVCVVHNETSVGLTNDLGAIAAEVRRAGSPLLLVDGISAVAGIPIQVKEWGIDAIVGGSQKGLAAPAGPRPRAHVRPRGRGAPPRRLLPRPEGPPGSAREERHPLDPRRPALPRPARGAPPAEGGRARPTARAHPPAGGGDARRRGRARPRAVPRARARVGHGHGDPEPRGARRPGGPKGPREGVQHPGPGRPGRAHRQDLPDRPHGDRRLAGPPRDVRRPRAHPRDAPATSRPPAPPLRAVVDHMP